jgi:hypothetical protein
MDVQTGLRPGTGIEDAFLVFESLCSKSLEWNLPLWFASLDLTKAFDRVEYGPLFEALLEQSVPKPYCALLWKLYQNQSGKLQQGHGFSVQRGVRQGDVISPFQRCVGVGNAEMETQTVGESWFGHCRRKNY